MTQTEEKTVHGKEFDKIIEYQILAFAKMIDSEYEMTWLNDDDKEITTLELAKEYLSKI